MNLADHRQGEKELLDWFPTSNELVSLEVLCRTWNRTPLDVFEWLAPRVEAGEFECMSPVGTDPYRLAAERKAGWIYYRRPARNLPDWIRIQYPLPSSERHWDMLLPRLATQACW